MSQEQINKIVKAVAEAAYANATKLAKMANYNLEQTLMGNEARYLHR